MWCQCTRVCFLILVMLPEENPNNACGSVTFNPMSTAGSRKCIWMHRKLFQLRSIEGKVKRWSSRSWWPSYHGAAYFFPVAWYVYWPFPLRLSPSRATRAILAPSKIGEVNGWNGPLISLKEQRNWLLRTGESWARGTSRFSGRLRQATTSKLICQFSLQPRSCSSFPRPMTVFPFRIKLHRIYGSCTYFTGTTRWTLPSGVDFAQTIQMYSDWHWLASMETC